KENRVFALADQPGKPAADNNEDEDEGDEATSPGLGIDIEHLVPKSVVVAAFHRASPLLQRGDRPSDAVVNGRQAADAMPTFPQRERAFNEMETWPVRAWQ